MAQAKMAMKKKELQDMAEGLGLEFDRSATKGQLVELINFAGTIPGAPAARKRARCARGVEASGRRGLGASPAQDKARFQQERERNPIYRRLTPGTVLEKMYLGELYRVVVGKDRYVLHFPPSRNRPPAWYPTLWTVARVIQVPEGSSRRWPDNPPIRFFCLEQLFRHGPRTR